MPRSKERVNPYYSSVSKASWPPGMTHIFAEPVFSRAKSRSQRTLIVSRVVGPDGTRIDVGIEGDVEHPVDDVPGLHAPSHGIAVHLERRPAHHHPAIGRAAI